MALRKDRRVKIFPGVRFSSTHLHRTLQLDIDLIVLRHKAHEQAGRAGLADLFQTGFAYKVALIPLDEGIHAHFQGIRVPEIPDGNEALLRRKAFQTHICGDNLGSVGPAQTHQIGHDPVNAGVVRKNLIAQLAGKSGP